MKTDKAKELMNAKITKEVVINNFEYYFSVKKFEEATRKLNKNLKKSLQYLMTKAYLYAQLEIILKDFYPDDGYSFIDVNKFADFVNRRLMIEAHNDKLFSNSETGSMLFGAVFNENIIKLLNEWLKEHEVYVLKNSYDDISRFIKITTGENNIAKVVSIETWLEPWMLYQVFDGIRLQK